jgi:ubiquinone/menaquinone biosynthesis C-methylase UbiE
MSLRGLTFRLSSTVLTALGSSQDREYLIEQKRFWNVDEETSKFGRVDTISSNELEYNRRAQEDFETIFSGIQIEPTSTILEIGCGIGRLLALLVAQTRSGRVIGVDISEGMIQQARAALGERDNLTLEVNSGADLSMIPDRSIDFIYSKDVFIHIHGIGIVKSYLTEVERVLRPSGSFRFNVRLMDTATMFSNSPGGLWAKVAYSIGVLSPIRSDAGPPIPGFDGLQYRERDLRQLATAAGLEITTFVRGGEIWCTCRLAQRNIARDPREHGKPI